MEKSNQENIQSDNGKHNAEQEVVVTANKLTDTALDQNNPSVIDNPGQRDANDRNAESEGDQNKAEDLPQTVDVTKQPTDVVVPENQHMNSTMDNNKANSSTKKINLNDNEQNKEQALNTGNELNDKDSGGKKKENTEEKQGCKLNAAHKEQSHKDNEAKSKNDVLTEKNETAEDNKVESTQNLEDNNKTNNKETETRLEDNSHSENISADNNTKTADPLQKRDPIKLDTEEKASIGNHQNKRVKMSD